MWLRLGFLLYVVIASGCARPVQTTVNAYSNFKAGDVHRSLALIPYEPAQSQSLEWQSFAAQIAQRLSGAGYTIIADPGAAELFAFFGYAIDEGKAVTSTFAIPQWGVTGYSGSTTTGTVSTTGTFSTLSATTTYQPQYGVTGYVPGSRTDILYTRSMSVDIVDKTTQERKWQMRLSSTGRCGAIGVVMPAFIEAAFTKFPESVSGNVDVPLKTDCGTQ